MQQCNNATMQQCNNATMQQCNNATMQQCNNATMQQYTTIVNEIPSFFSIRDKDLKLIFLNKAIKLWIQQHTDADIIGLSNDLIKEKTKNHPQISTLFDENDKQLKKFLKGNNDNYTTVLSYVNEDFKYCFQLTRFKVYLKNELYICSLANDITSLMDEIKEIQIQSCIDDLTNVFNRKILESINFQKTDIFLYIDLDNFKIINDTRGHQAGDIVLTKFSKLLMNTFRKNQDYIVRTGGDEFLIIIRSETESIDMQLKIKELKVGFDKVFSTFAPLGFSSGYCNYTTSVLDTMDICDGLMYENKHKNKLLSIIHDA